MSAVSSLDTDDDDEYDVDDNTSNDVLDIGSATAAGGGAAEDRNPPRRPVAAAAEPARRPSVPSQCQHRLTGLSVDEIYNAGEHNNCLL